MDNPIEKQRRIFCNRTLNLRGVKAIGYDMDYTLVHYNTAFTEKRIYFYSKQKLLSMGKKLAHVQFIPDLFIRGLIVDTHLGNILKVDSFGLVKQAMHGTKTVSEQSMQEIYRHEIISLHNRRYAFLNTLFSLAECCLYAQSVDAMEKGDMPLQTYESLFEEVRGCVELAHIDEQLKNEVAHHPSKFVELDADMAAALRDQWESGKKLLLITNSDWEYSRQMMSYVFSRYLPKHLNWRDLFAGIFVSAHKPSFFTERSFLFEVVGDHNLLRPCYGIPSVGKVYWGGDANGVEQMLALKGEEILYVGDHIYGDVNVSKSLLRWRTALILRELEDDILAVENFAKKQQQLNALLQQKSSLEQQISRLRLQRLHCQHHSNTVYPQSLEQQIEQKRMAARALDEKIAPLAKMASTLNNPHWGLLMRAGNDKSHLARQVERYADIYMSRVSNFLHATPYAYLRAQRGTLPHDLDVML